jgi:hypothetical protein
MIFGEQLVHYWGLKLRPSTAGKRLPHRRLKQDGTYDHQRRPSDLVPFPADAMLKQLRFVCVLKAALMPGRRSNYPNYSI